MQASSDGVTMVAPRRPMLDRILAVIGATLLIAVLVAGAFLAYSYMQARSLEDAATPTTRLIAELRAAVEASPNDPDLRARLGEVFIAAGRHNDATKELSTALEINPDHTGAHLMLGVMAMLDKDYTSSESYFLKIIELTEGSQFQNVKLHRELAYFYLGEAALETERYDQAIGYYKATIRMNRGSADAYFGLGLALKGLEDYEVALENLEIALAFDPNFAEAHYEMGQIYLVQDDRINAAVHFVEASKLAPDNELPLEALASLGTPGEWETRAREALAAGDTDAALESALVARTLASEDPAYVVLHAEVLEAMGKRDVAVDVYNEALTLSPDDPAIKAAITRLEQE